MIHISEPLMNGKEREFVNLALDRNELSWRGTFVPLFESKFASDIADTKYALATSSGTTALHLALATLKIGPGDDVYVPTISYVATANAVRYCGANVIFVEVDGARWTMHPDALRDAIEKSTGRPAAVICVHLFGAMADVIELNKIAALHGMVLIEDAAQAHGATFSHQDFTFYAGSLGEFGIFSFFANKIITTGEGGALCTDHPDLRDRAAHLRGQAHTVNFYHDEVGFNYRMTNLQAAIGLAQLDERNFKNKWRMRQQCYDFYNEKLGPFVELQLRHDGAAPWLFTCIVPDDCDRDQLMFDMQLRGVETRPMFTPLPSLPMYQQEVSEQTARLGAKGISLPTHPSMTINNLETVTDAFLSCLAKG